jgi:arylsulfatase A-like enzyme
MDSRTIGIWTRCFAGDSLPSLALIISLSLAFPDPAVANAPAEPLNVLFIAVDDLRPDLGAYGNPVVHTPNLDRLAAEGLLFTRAYCMVAICHPSRAAVLTGKRPTTSGIYEFRPEIREAMPQVVTLPQHFKSRGYHAQAIGKIFHGPNLDDPHSWSVPSYWPASQPYHTPEGIRIMKRVESEKPFATLVDPSSGQSSQHRMRGLPCEAPNVPDHLLDDGSVTERAVDALRQVRDRRFFLAVGYFKPHLPFVAPKRYWDLYDPASLPLPSRASAPEGAPHYALYGWQDTRRYWGMPHEGPLPAAEARRLTHGYYACISFIDAQIGRLLEELDRLQLRDRTIVLVWGDHGYNLGEYGEWDKRNNYEASTRSPLLVRAPGHAPGRRTNALVEFVDIFPSLCDLAGVPALAGLEGTSFKPLLKDTKRQWKRAAFSHTSREVAGAGVTLGHAMRTDRYRFVEWVNASGSLREHELYDLHSDPVESENLARRPELAGLVGQLSAQLWAGWRSALPPRAEFRPPPSDAPSAHLAP